MATEAQDILQSLRDDFQKAIDFSLRVSHTLNGEPTTDQLSYASVIHTKMSVTAASTEHLMCARLADHSAIIALCRMIMESMILYSYIVEPINEEQWNCRKLCLRLHDTANRIKLMRGFQSENEYGDLLEGKQRLERELHDNLYFKSLKDEQQARLLTGEHFYMNGVRGAVQSTSWNSRRYFALHSYFSSHAHSSPMSFFRVRKHKVNFSDPSEAQRNAVGLALEVAMFCLLKTTLMYLSTAKVDRRSKFDSNELAKFQGHLDTLSIRFCSDETS